MEYKDELLQDTQDTQEKCNVGALWEEKSHSKGLFLLATTRDQDGRRIYEQLRYKVSQMA